MLFFSLACVFLSPALFTPARSIYAVLLLFCLLFLSFFLSVLTSSDLHFFCNHLHSNYTIFSGVSVFTPTFGGKVKPTTARRRWWVVVKSIYRRGFRGKFPPTSEPLKALNYGKSKISHNPTLPTPLQFPLLSSFDCFLYILFLLFCVGCCSRCL